MKKLDFIMKMVELFHLQNRPCYEVYETIERTIKNTHYVDDVFFEETFATVICIDGDIEGTYISGGDLPYELLYQHICCYIEPVDNYNVPAEDIELPF